MGYDEDTGRRNYHNKTVRGTRKDAEKYLSQKLRELDTGTFVEPVPVTVDAYLDQWLENAARPKLAELSFQHYSDMLRRYVRPALGKKKLAAVRPLDVQALYSDMQKRGLSSRIVRYTHAVLNSAFKQAVKWKMVPQNPAEHIELPKKERKEMQALTPEQAAKFLKAAGADKLAVLFNLAVVAGLRPSEYLGLQWKDQQKQAKHPTASASAAYAQRAQAQAGRREAEGRAEVSQPRPGFLRQGGPAPAHAQRAGPPLQADAEESGTA
jgi:integrase